MNFFELWLLRLKLRNIDFQDAAYHMRHQFTRNQMVLPKPLADLFELFIINPCEDTALNLLKFDPKFIGMFKAFKK